MEPSPIITVIPNIETETLHSTIYKYFGPFGCEFRFGAGVWGLRGRPM